MAGNDEVAVLRAEIAHLHKDCQDLVDFIVSARSEISQIRPNDLKSDKLPRAGKELDAIVLATESATDTIMSAAERIMSAGVVEANVVNDACMEIFEACSFQDITGQRISKVVSTLEYIEQYLDRLTTAWGHRKDAPPETPPSEEQDDEAGLLNGPALAGEGIDQQYVDDMFGDTASDASEENADSPEKKPAPSEKPKKASSGDENIDQDDIDALFN
ncbi:protein phosphatase CheZ [Sneathiella sp.]|jgi:chemotaxis protein CheZ|uniref:protein phosphatase CheZ n=1 Tax=Sneathiella sp. TaxID=1964365 RepID=UPI0039E4E069